MTKSVAKKRPSTPRDTRRTGPLKGLGQPPTSPIKDTYKWVDYLELRCCASPDGEVSVGDLNAWLRQDRSDAPDLDDTDQPSSEESDVSQEEDDPLRAALDAIEEESSGAASRKSDNRRRLAEDVFRLVRYRESLYGELYPFALSAAGDRLALADELTPVHNLYLFLLLCSSGRYVSKHGKLTKDFERLCVPTLKGLVPTASVHVFGTAKSEGSEYVGTFKKKLARLAANLGEPIGPAVDDIGDEETGDHGLDVAGIVDMGDVLGGKLTIFAQAACTDDWQTKQDSPAPEAWDSLVLLTSPAVVACCIPLCFRNEQGGWHNRSFIHRRLILDRRRMLHWLEPAAAEHLRDCVKARSIVGRLVTTSYVG